MADAASGIVVTIILSVSTLVGCASLPSAEVAANSSAKHSFVLTAQGSSTVILEAGWGNGRESWAPIYNSLSQITQVCAYDRAGYGSSRSSNTERDGATIVQQLHTLLQWLDLAPPYVLVGHSLGGTYMELYARTYPEQVAGVVLVDSRHTDFTRQCQQSGIKICAPPRRIVNRFPIELQGEIKGLNRTIDSIMNSGDFPNLPLSVLTGAK